MEGLAKKEIIAQLKEKILRWEGFGTPPKNTGVRRI